MLTSQNFLNHTRHLHFIRTIFPLILPIHSRYANVGAVEKMVSDNSHPRLEAFLSFHVSEGFHTVLVRNDLVQRRLSEHSSDLNIQPCF